MFVYLDTFNNLVRIWTQARSHIAILLPSSLQTLIQKEKCCVNINVILVMELWFMGYQILEKMSASFLALWVWELIRKKKITILLPSSLPPQYKENNVMSTVMLSWLWSFTVIGFKNENIFCLFACLFGRLQRKMGANLTLLLIKL